MKPTRRAALLASSLAVVLIAAGSAFGTAPVPCEGTVQLTGTSNFQSRTAGPQTFVTFDFTGLHDICLADGSDVQGVVVGHLVQRTSGDGDLSIRFDEVLHYNGGTLGYRGEASLSNGKWQSHVQTVGEGTGALAGIRGQGTFWPTGPTSFGDLISYVYAP